MVLKFSDQTSAVLVKIGENNGETVWIFPNDSLFNLSAFLDFEANLQSLP